MEKNHDHDWQIHIVKMSVLKLINRVNIIPIKVINIFCRYREIILEFIRKGKGTRKAKKTSLFFGEEKEWWRTTHPTSGCVM